MGNPIPQNVGRIDRFARLVVGSLLLVVGIVVHLGFPSVTFEYLPQGLPAVLLVLAGFGLFASGLVRFCLVKRILGLSGRGT